MKVYNYTDDKIYYGESEAQPSPAEPGKFLIPRNATTIEPPLLEVNQQAYWNETAWEIQNISQPEPESEPQPEPITWDTIRAQRDGMLYMSDWTDLPNSPVNNKEAWLNYRQALRDITKTFSQPEDVVWPTKP
jgi:hypothetical protein